MRVCRMRFGIVLEQGSGALKQLRLLFGEMADALLLSSQRCVPVAAQSLGFKFEYPHLQETFAAIFKK